MGMQSVQATKELRAAAILSNSVYMPSSGAIKNLMDSLCRLSANDLGMLQLIIDIKLRDAAGLPRGEETEWHAPSAVHPATCPGCTANTEKWGTPIK